MLLENVPFSSFDFHGDSVTGIPIGRTLFPSCDGSHLAPIEMTFFPAFEDSGEILWTIDDNNKHYQSFNWVSPIDRQGLLSTTRFDRLAPFRSTPPCQAALPVSRFRQDWLNWRHPSAEQFFDTEQQKMHAKPTRHDKSGVLCSYAFSNRILNEEKLLDHLQTVSGRICFVSPHFSLFLLCEVDCESHSSRSFPGAFWNSHRSSVGQQGCGEEAKGVRGEHWQDATTSQTRWG